MDMSIESIPASTKIRGTGSITVEAGKHLKIETTPGGEEILDWENTTGSTVYGDIEINLRKT